MRESASARRTGGGLPESIRVGDLSNGRRARSPAVHFDSKKEPHHLRRGRLGLPSSGRHATKHSRHGPSRLRSDFVANYAAAAKRTFGEPSTPLFCIAAFRSSEPNHVRAFATSATSWRMTTSFGSSALRNTLPFVMPAETRPFSCPSYAVRHVA